MGDMKTYSLEELSKHNTKQERWLAIHGKVYNVTKYLEDHPGGVDALVEVSGTDATSHYEDVGHSEDAREILENFLIGNLEGGSRDHPDVPTVASSSQVKFEKKPAAKPKAQPVKPQVLSVTNTAIAGSVAILGSTAMARFHLLGPFTSMSGGGFWMGFLVSSLAGMSIATALVIFLEKLASTSVHAKYPAHLIQPAVVPQLVTKALGVLNPREYQHFPLVKKTRVSNDTLHLVFALPRNDAILGLPIGQHVAIRAEVDGKTVSRSYTPISNNKDVGRLELCIKVYNNGVLTGGYLDKLNVGDQVEFRGPKGQMRYRKGMCEELGMICGGSGITPMFQIVRAIMEDKSDATRISMIYANKTEGDILLKDKLENFANLNPKKLSIWYMLDQPPPGWKHGAGRVNKDLFKEKLPSASANSKILLCGPPGMIKGSQGALVELGFPPLNAVSKMSDRLFSF